MPHTPETRSHSPALHKVYRFSTTSLPSSQYPKSPAPAPAPALSLSLHREPIPTPSNHEVLVRIRAVSLNNRELLISTGTYPLPVKSNLVPCSDMAGEVVAVGGSAGGVVSDFKVGDRVIALFNQNHLFGPQRDWNGALGGAIDGVLQEYRIFEHTALLHIPSNLSFNEAATLPLAGVTAWNALFGAGVERALKSGMTVLFQGTGGVSIQGLVLAHAIGAKTIITSSSDAKLKIAKKMGATHTINYRSTPRWDEAVLELTHGNGVDLVLDTVGISQLAQCINCLAIGGSISCVGFLGDSSQVLTAPLPSNILQPVLMKCATLRGVLIGSKQVFQNLLDFVESNDVRFPISTPADVSVHHDHDCDHGQHPHQRGLFDFDHAQEAMEYLASGQHVGKVVIEIP